jgi:protein translocase SecG subunit
MLKFFLYIVSFFLIILIFLRIPENNVGLSGFFNVGSPRSSQSFLNNLIAFMTFIYFIIALILNL